MLVEAMPVACVPITAVVVGAIITSKLVSSLDGQYPFVPAKVAYTL